MFKKQMRNRADKFARCERIIFGAIESRNMQMNSWLPFYIIEKGRTNEIALMDFG